MHKHSGVEVERGGREEGREDERKRVREVERQTETERQREFYALQSEGRAPGTLHHLRGRPASGL